MSSSVTYICRARLDGISFIFLWEDDSPSSKPVVTDDKGMIVVFDSELQAREKLTAEGKSVSPDAPHSYDFDEVLAWCSSEDRTVDCSPVLNLWSILTDVPREKVLFDAADARASEVYDKLFRGRNIDAVAPAGQLYVPIWSQREISELKRLLMLGISDFRSRVPGGVRNSPPAARVGMAARVARGPSRFGDAADGVRTTETDSRYPTWASLRGGACAIADSASGGLLVHAARARRRCFRR